MPGPASRILFNVFHRFVATVRPRRNLQRHHSDMSAAAGRQQQQIVGQSLKRK